MHPVHIGISIINLLCGIAALIGFFANVPSLIALGVFLGYWAHLAAFGVALWVLVLLSIRMFSGRVRELFAHHWLAFVNVGVIVLIWSVILVVEKLNQGNVQ